MLPSNPILIIKDPIFYMLGLRLKVPEAQQSGTADLWTQTGMKIPGLRALLVTKPERFQYPPWLLPNQGPWLGVS